MQGMKYLLASRKQARTAAGANDSAQKLACMKQLLDAARFNREPGRM
jgi:hypothetical protein